MMHRLCKIFKYQFVKLSIIAVVVLSLGWGMSLVAIDDIKSATANFSVIGTVSDISDGEIKITEAKGSNSSSQNSYELNIKHIENIQTSDYEGLTINHIKVGDKIIAQGLTNGSTFFIKRIISFATNIDEVDAEIKEGDITSTSTDVMVASTTDDALTEDVIGQTELISTSTATTTDIDTASTTTEDVLDMSTTTTATTTDDSVSTSTSTTTEDQATSTSAIIEAITDVIDTVVEIIDTVVDVVTGNDAVDVVDSEIVPA